MKKSLFLLFLFSLLSVFNVFGFSDTWYVGGNTFNFDNSLCANGNSMSAAPGMVSSGANLGVMWASANVSDIAFNLIFDGNFTNTTFCTPKGLNISLLLYVDSDKNVATGCNTFGDPASCFPGADRRILLNGTNFSSSDFASLMRLQFWNTTTTAFQNNDSVVFIVNSTEEACSSHPPYTLSFYLSQGALGLSPSNLNGPIRDLSVKLTSTFPNSTLIDELIPGSGFGFSGGQGCQKYTNQTACQTTSINEGLTCTWNSQFNGCSDDFSAIQDCNHFAGLCKDQTNCTLGTQFRAPGTWDTATTMCREPFLGGDIMVPCANACMGCFAQSSCEQTGGGQAGRCQWKTVDPVINTSECRPANERICSVSNPTLCNNPASCTTLGSEFNWSNSLGVCLYVNMTNGTTSQGAVDFTEICFNGVDDNGNGRIDCSDSICFNSAAGIDAWKTADPSCGGGFNPTDFGLNIGAGFNPEFFKQDLFFKGGASGPPVIIGEDQINETVAVKNASEIDIKGLGIKDMDSAFGIGIATSTNNFAPQCHPHNGNVANMTQKFFYVVDSDDNVSTGCNVNYNLTGSNAATLTGVDYLYSYVVNETNGTETKIGYKCSNVSGSYAMIAFSAGLAGMPASERNFICSFPDGGGASVLVIPKNSIGKGTAASLRVPMKISVFTGNISASVTIPAGSNMTISNAVDSLIGSYYTPGTADVKPTDCFSNPTACGSNFALQGGGKFFRLEDCVSSGDEDSNGLSDCADPLCSFVPQCRSSSLLYNASADKTAPTLYSTRAETQRDGAFLIVQTSKPTNLTVSFYGINTTCSNTPILLYDLGDPGFTFDDYRSFHGLSLFNGTVPEGNGSVVTLNITNDTVHFYKATVTAENGKRAVTSCLNFTTAPGSQDRVVAFRPIFNADQNNPLLNSLAIRFKHPNGTIAQSISANSSTVTTNVSVLTNITLELTGVNGTGVAFEGVNIAKAAEINFTNAFNVTQRNSSYGYVSLNSTKWNEISQLLGASTVVITVPGTGDSLMHCDDDGTSNCLNITNETGVSKLLINTSTKTSTWRVPSTIGFSSYATTTTVPATSSSTTTAASSSSGGSGRTTKSAVEPTLTSTLFNAKSGEELKFTFDGEKSSIVDVKFVVANDIKEAKMSSSEISATQINTLVTQQLGVKVFKYYEIKPTSFTNADLKGDVISGMFYLQHY
ncbi:hypothetical protein J4230_04475 [Candidatus Woesearchaeota archaeon]|nr:hypothetical protein [Candidatus Woesearchaeota archaeon]